MTNDEIKGRAALVHFHNEALDFPENYHFSFEELVSALQKKSNGQFLDGFGFAINSAEMSESAIKTAMINLADAGEGQLPAKWNDFFNALTKEATKFSFVDAATYTAAQTAKDLAVGAQQVGNAVIQTGSILTGIMPVVVVGAVLFIVAMRSKKLAGV
jgi:hypothetical protein